MSDMSLFETRERFIESMKRAASRARELAVVQQNASWFDLAISLDGIRETGSFLSTAVSRSKNEVESDIQNHLEQKGLLN